MVDGTENTGEYWPQICDTSVVQFPANSQAEPELNCLSITSCQLFFADGLSSFLLFPACDFTYPSETVVNNIANRAIPPSDILINFSRPCDDAPKEADSLLRCRRLDGRRLNCSGIALYLYGSRDTTPLIEANILEIDMAVELCAVMGNIKRVNLNNTPNRILACSVDRSPARERVPRRGNLSRHPEQKGMKKERTHKHGRRKRSK